ncbi:hypothetical protein [Levilactobacillus sp. HBUAS70063]|uniref:hypothetical protein n=1 Tax=Levilactobacillus sp. HBUAS70063 TaxID=3109359 RepID=UPI00313329F8
MLRKSQRRPVVAANRWGYAHHLPNPAQLRDGNAVQLENMTEDVATHPDWV